MTVVTENLSRRERQKLEKRERIRRAAWELFTSQGYSATTTKQVASRAGVAAGTLFLYTKDKADLLFMVFHERLREAVDAQFATLPREACLLDQLLHVFRGPFDCYADVPELAREFVRCLPGAEGPNADRVNGYTLSFLHQVAGVVIKAQERGEVGAHVVPLQAASNLFSLYFGALMLWLGGFMSLRQVLDPVLRSSFELQISGFRPH